MEPEAHCARSCRNHQPTFSVSTFHYPVGRTPTTSHTSNSIKSTSDQAIPPRNGTVVAFSTTTSHRFRPQRAMICLRQQVFHQRILVVLKSSRAEIQEIRGPNFGTLDSQKKPWRECWPFQIESLQKRFAKLSQQNLWFHVIWICLLRPPGKRPGLQVPPSHCKIYRNPSTPAIFHAVSNCH